MQPRKLNTTSSHPRPGLFYPERRWITKQFVIVTTAPRGRRPPNKQKTNKHTNKPTNTQPHKHINTQPHKYTNTKPHNFTTTQPHNFTTTHTHTHGESEKFDLTSSVNHKDSITCAKKRSPRNCPYMMVANPLVRFAQKHAPQLSLNLELRLEIGQRATRLWQNLRIQLEPFEYTIYIYIFVY